MAETKEKAKPILSVKNLKKYYNYGKIKAVDDISLEILKGEKFGLLGENGAGKTTLIRTILGLLNKNSGTIELFGKEISIFDSTHRGKIGYIQGEIGLPKHLTGNQFLNYLIKMHNNDIKWEEITNLAKRFDLDLKNDMGQLSKGNKQKIGIIACLMQDYELLILDEPTSGLDPLKQREFFKILNSIRERSNTTILLCSHIFSEVESFCEKVAIIRNGKILSIESIEELIKKNFKVFQFSFESEDSCNELANFLKENYSKIKYEIEISTNTSELHKIMIFSPFRDHLEVLENLIKRKWANHEIVDINIEDADLESIFMEFYALDQEKEDLKTNGGVEI